MTRNTLAIILIVLVAGTVSLSILDWGAPGIARTTSYDADEATVFMSLRNMNPSRLDFNPDYLDYPHFHFYLTGGAVFAGKLLGLYQLVADEDYYLRNPGEWRKIFLVVRLFNLVFSLLLVVAVFALLREFFPPGLALLITAIFAFCGARFEVGGIIGNETSLTLWFTLFFRHLVRGLNRKLERFFCLKAGFLMAMAGGSTPIAFFLFLPLGLFLFAFHRECTTIGERLRAFLIVAATALVVFAALNPYCAAQRFMSVEESKATGFGMTSTTFLHLYRASGESVSLVRWFRGLATIVEIWSYSFGAVTLLAIATGALLSLRAVHRSARFLTISLVLPYLAIAAFGGPGVITEDRIFPFLPGLMVWIGLTLDSAFLRHRRWLMVLMALAIVVETGLWSLTRWEAKMLHPDPRKSASEWLVQNMEPGRTVGAPHVPFWADPDLVYMEYFHPAGRLKLAGNDPDFTIFQRTAPDYVVLSNHDLHWRHRSNRSLLEFLDENYRLRERFKVRHQRWWCVIDTDETPISITKIPTIDISERKEPEP